MTATKPLPTATERFKNCDSCLPTLLANWKHLKHFYPSEQTEDTCKKVSLDVESNSAFELVLQTGSTTQLKNHRRADLSFSFTDIFVPAVGTKHTFAETDGGGRFSNENVFANTALWKHLLSKTLQSSYPNPLSEQDAITPYVFIGFETSPLKLNLMRLFPKMHATENFETRFLMRAYPVPRKRMVTHSKFKEANL